MPSRSTEGIRRRVPFLQLDISMVLNPEQPTEPTLGMIESQLVEEPVTATSDSGVNAQSSELVIMNHCPPEFY